MLKGYWEKLIAVVMVLFVLLALVAADLSGATQWRDKQEFNAEARFDATTYFGTADKGTTAVASNCVTDDTDSGGGTQTLTGVIPAGAVTLGVTCRVNTTLAGSSLSTWSLGDGTDADLYGTTLALAAGTTVDKGDYTASPLTQAWSSSAGDLTMTAAAGQFDSGNITCCASYLISTAPSS